MWITVLCVSIGLVIGLGAVGLASRVTDEDLLDANLRRYTRVYGTEETGHTYGPGEMHKFNPNRGGRMKSKTCFACGQTIPGVPVGTLVQHKFSRALGVVVVKAGLVPETYIAVTLVTGINKGKTQTWYRDSAESVTGSFHVTTRETL